MDSQNSKKSSTFSKVIKFVVVGTVAAAVCTIGSLYPGTPQNSVNFLGQQPSEVEHAFINFIAKYGRTYASKEELPRRFEIFSKNFAMVKSHNEKPNTTFKMGINAYSDLELHEFLPQENFFNPEAFAPEDLLSEEDAVELINKKNLQQIKSTDFDWRDQNKLMPVGNQGSCGSSWAFSSAAQLESALAILMKNPVADDAVSVQQIIDCDFTNNGCRGGWPVTAWQNIAKKGFAPLLSYPRQYVGAQRSCIEVPTFMRKPTILRGKQFLQISQDSIKSLINVQPVGVAVNAPQCFLNYQSGIMSQIDCDCSANTYSQVKVNYLVTLVGYGTTPQDDPDLRICPGYFIARTSFGEQWGEQGHIRLCMMRNKDTERIGTCNMLTHPHLPEVGLFN